MNLLRQIPLILFMIGYASIAVAGTRTNMVFQWPGYVLFGLAACVTLFSFRRKLRASPGGWCIVTALLLTAYVIIRGVLSPVPAFARMDVVMVIAAALTYLLFSVYLVRTRYRLAFVGLLLALSIGNIMVGLYQRLNDATFSVLPGYTRLHPEAAGGFYDNHNNLAGFLLIAFAFVVALAFFGRMGAKTRSLVVFLVALTLLGIAMAASRGGYLALGALLLALVILGLVLARRMYQYEFKKMVVTAAVLGVIGLVPAVVLANKALGDRHGIGKGEELNLGLGSNVRFTTWSLAVDQWKENPVFGEGARMYSIYSIKHWPQSMFWVRADPEFAHNDYLQMLAEYGAVGLGLMGLFVLAHVVSGIRYLFWYMGKGFARSGERTENPLALCLGALLVLAAYAIHSVFDFNLHLPANVIPVAFAFGVLATPSSRASRDRNRLDWGVVGGRALLPIAGLVLMAGGVLFARAEWHLEQARQAEITDYAPVISHLDKALDAGPASSEAHQLRGRALMFFGFDFDIEPVQRGFMERAIESFREALELNPYDVWSHIGLGRCLAKLGENEEAEASFKTALELAPLWIEPHLRYGDFQIDLGVDAFTENLVAATSHFETAKEEYLRCRKANDKMVKVGDPADVGLRSARRYLAIAYEEHAHRLADAAEELRGADGQSSEEEVAFLNSAKAYYEKALAEGSKATTLAPGIIAVRKRLAESEEP